MPANPSTCYCWLVAMVGLTFGYPHMQMLRAARVAVNCLSCSVLAAHRGKLSHDSMKKVKCSKSFRLLSNLP